MDFNKGQGLGLSLCYAIIRKHGGMISADNVSGAGARLNIWLPAYEKTM
jgi:signal transduction histidine kinase